MKAFEYVCVNEIDPTDWSRGKVTARDKEHAKRKIRKKLWMTGMKLKKGTLNFVHYK